MSRSGDETAVTEEAQPKESLPNLFSLFPKINFQLPFLPPKPQEPNPEAQAQQELPKPSRVQFPKTQVAMVASSPLLAEPNADHSPAAKTTNPLILWQDEVHNGNWDEVEKYLSGFTKVDDNRYSMKIFFEIRQQRYLEALNK
ncbi:Protein TOPLESS [Glycine soja]|uniref:Protein TOPLESS n=1 Tax=Glycine soja TaxID=3848 RepID=A0A0B2RUR4_GLYSO|nr:Protein TOPLESS [Glycine soja]